MCAIFVVHTLRPLEWISGWLQPHPEFALLLHHLILLKDKLDNRKWKCGKVASCIIRQVNGGYERAFRWVFVDKPSKTEVAVFSWTLNVTNSVWHLLLQYMFKVSKLWRGCCCKPNPDPNGDKYCFIIITFCFWMSRKSVRSVCASGELHAHRATKCEAVIWFGRNRQIRFLSGVAVDWIVLLKAYRICGTNFSTMMSMASWVSICSWYEWFSWPLCFNKGVGLMARSTQRWTLCTLNKGQPHLVWDSWINVGALLFVSGRL